MIHYLSKTTPAKLKGIALVRLDFNTEDESRLMVSLPTLKLLSRKSKSVVIVSHKGRPSVKISGGKFEGIDAKNYSLRAEAAILSRLLRKPVQFIPHFRFEEIQKVVRAAPRGSIFLLENIRFLPGEAENDIKLGRALASLADYYVNDAFAVSHRVAASLVAVTRYLPAYAGLGLEREMTSLSAVIKKTKHPFVVVVGGAKASDKIDVLWNLGRKADAFLLGGGAANTMLMLRGTEIGLSIRDEDPRDIAKLKQLSLKKKIVSPEDWLAENERILDIGPKTAAAYAKKLRSARTILWSGPMGMTEKVRFEAGTLSISRAIALNRKTFSVAGGGETVAFLKKHKLDKKFSFISTGGGAMLEFLAGKKLPGIGALK